jgi:hypothetical protein
MLIVGAGTKLVGSKPAGFTDADYSEGRKIND